MTKSEELLVSIIEGIDKHINSKTDIYYKSMSEQQRVIKRYEHIIDTLESHLRQLEMQVNDPLQKIKSLNDMKEKLYEQPRSFLFDRTNEDVKHIIKNIDKEIAESQNLKKENDETIKLFKSAISEIRFEIKLMAFKK